LNQILKYYALFAALFYYNFLFPQDDALDHIASAIVEESLKDESEEFIDLSDLRDQLLYLSQHPVNINSSEIEKLLELGLINFNQKYLIEAYIKEHGKILAIEELTQIKDFDIAFIKSLKPFIQFSGISDNRNINFQQIVAEGKNDLTLHYEFITQKAKAYTDSTPSYLGDPARIMIKYNLKFYKRWRAGFNVEKDAGEQIHWNFKSVKPGFDHQSAFISYQGNGLLKEAILGDFQCGFAQGLTFWRGFSFGKSSNSVPIRKVNSGIRPHSGMDEYNYLRGLGLLFSKRRIQAIGFISFRNLDASPTDSTMQTFSTISKGGYHRTVNELARSGQLKELLWAASLSYSLPHLKMGIAYAHQLFHANLVAKQDIFSIGQFSGRSNYLLGATVDYSFKNGHAFSEVSGSANGGYAFLVGTVITLDPSFSLGFLHRNYARDFQPISSNAFAESSLNQNEIGNYLGFEYKYSRKIVCNAYTDIFQFPWVKKSTGRPSEGQEILFKISYKRSKKQLFSLRYRFKNTKLNFDQIRNQLRLDYDQAISEIIRFRYRAEFHFLNFPDKQMGYLFFIDLILQSPEKPFSLSARYALFDTDNYDTRIYAYERDVYFAYSIKPYYYRGQKIYLNLKYRMRRFFTFSFRISHLKFPYLETIGSGNDLINSNAKTALTFQLRIRW
jgi:hypothetical protein